MSSASQQKHLDLPRGVFLIKYDSAEDMNFPPKMTLSSEGRNHSSVEFILPPDIADASLWSPGASLVVRVKSPTRLLVEISTGRLNGSLAARLQSIPLSTDPLGLSAVQARAVQPDFSDLQLLGHLAGRGDVIVPPGEWLGGPAGPARIEGIAVNWPSRLRDFNLNYAVRVGAGKDSATAEISGVGTFSGTRGRALPLVGTTFELSGPSTEGYQITIDGIFLGSPQMRVSGRRVVLAGPTGREPLVGLRFQIVAVEIETARSAAPVVPAAVVPARKTGGGRVRVFRSKSASKV